MPSGVLMPPDCWVLMVTLEEALVAPGTTEGDEKLQFAPVGKFEQLSPTEFVKLPPNAETVMLVCA